MLRIVSRLSKKSILFWANEMNTVCFSVSMCGCMGMFVWRRCAEHTSSVYTSWWSQRISLGSVCKNNVLLPICIEWPWRRCFEKHLPRSANCAASFGIWVCGAAANCERLRWGKTAYCSVLFYATKNCDWSALEASFCRLNTYVFIVVHMCTTSHLFSRHFNEMFRF